MLRIMDQCKTRLKYLDDLKSHSFYFDEPDYKTPTQQRYLKQCKDKQVTILKDLLKLFKA